MNKLLTQSFSSFLRRRRAKAHFERRPLPGAMPAGPLATLALGQALLAAAHAAPAEALAALQSQADGLEAAEAARRLARDGPNDIQQDAPLPDWLRLWRCYLNPFNLLLTALALLSLLSADHRAAVTICVMVAMGVCVRFVQEGRSHRSAEGLRAMVTNTATVLRRSAAPAAAMASATASLEIPVRELVAGDVVTLSAGDMVPADCRVLSARDLFVAQAAMTGESFPVEKFVAGVAVEAGAEAGAAPAVSAAALDQRNLLFMGTNIISGSATALVVTTGARTYFGTLAAHALASPGTAGAAANSAPNAFQAGVNSVSWLLIRFAAVMVPMVFLINGFTKHNWLDAFLFALSVAVGLTPEMLPVIVTSTLARGAVLLSRKKVVVKRLDAIQNLGAMDILFTDKTGTLTQDKVALARHADADGQDSDEVLNFAYLNSYYQTGLKNLLDRAVLDHVELTTVLKLKEAYRKVDELPFDFERRRMSVVVATLLAGQDQHHELICKGAVEEVLAACTHVRTPEPSGAIIDASLDGERIMPTLPLDAALMARTMAVTAALNAEGLRVVAVAIKTLPPHQSTYSVADEVGLTLVGYIAFLDPPKASAAPALSKLAAHGITVKVLTGDNAPVTVHICRQLGLATDPVLLGAQVDALSDEALMAAAATHTLFAKLSPLHKERIVRALRAGGHVVGFMGDGINDAPALRAADIGISVDSAVDIAKEAADIILLEKSLLVLDEGVLEGRTTFCNMLKYIRMTASSNFGNVLSVLVASAFLPFLPMLPLQLLVQNLLYDFVQTGIPFDNVDAELITKPLQWKPADIGRFMLFFGPISSLFDLLTFSVMWWALDANSLARQTLFQSGWFVVGLLTQTLVVHLMRTPKLPLLQSRAAWPLTTLTLLIMVLALWLPMSPLAGYFKLQALPGAYYGWLVAILLGYGLLTSLMKRVYLRRYGWQ